MDSIIAQLTSALFDRYRVEREIGRGGMATVYLARDLRHDRQVALKVLDPELGAVLGVERFLSEIKVTANLQHPNLLPLFDSGAVDGLLFYVMPFVEGESLRDRISREKQLPVDDAVRIAIAIAGALEYAHGHGVIHRDLKPENILLQAGQPVIADFGIALAVSKAGGERITQTGVSLGTPLYMSPEQATGDRTVDGRSDIYSLAALTYEMLVGDPPHTASTAQGIIAKVLTEKPADVRVLRDAVGDNVAYAIHRALEKLPADRWATAAQFAEALQGWAGGPRTGTLPAGALALLPARQAWRATRMALGASVLIAAAGIWGWLNPRATDPPGVLRFDLTMPARAPFTPLPGVPVELTSDGRMLVYSGRGAGGQQLYRRQMDQLDATALQGTLGAQHFAISPDGRSVAFIVDEQLRQVPTDGGATTTIARVTAPAGTSWGSGEAIIMGSMLLGTGLSQVSAAGGTMRPFTAPDTAKGEWSHRWPRVLPDGKTVLFTIWPRNGGVQSARIGIASLESTEHAALGVLGSYPFGVFSGYLVYARADGSIMAVAVDLGRRRVTGEPVLHVDSVVMGEAGASKASLSRNGMLVYQVGTHGFQLATVDVQGGAISILVPQLRTFGNPAYSPDGKKIALVLGWTSRGSVWVFDIAAATLSPLSATDTSSDNRSPAWTADGRRLIFESDRSGRRAIWVQAADGSAPAELLVTSESDVMEPTPSRDGRMLVYRKGEGPSAQLWYRSFSGDTTAKPLGSPGVREQSPSLSPDGRWLAYESAEAGSRQIFVRAFPGPPSKWPVSDAGGTEPRWSPDGRTIYYRSVQGVIAAHVRTSPTFSVSSRVLLFPDNFTIGRRHQNYDISPDGKRFAMVPYNDQARALVVVSNWLTELRARMAGARAP